ncbi:unnamed protein product [Lepeophtheirus salmonis]|uniref:(salmon louse) hypothetical protein n=1 Tax=Lepeophtheirus salmonis TaxID=72036 RepID=A0A7R8D8D9_LEPSM|nr:unnamed protein product [Lepeophtheirus salmonis]CAF3035917.1 unnamed protein product [Lepeophtheirus salmonis]
MPPLLHDMKMELLSQNIVVFLTGWKKGLTVTGIPDILQDNNEGQYDIFFEPPDQDNISDSDSGNEKEGMELGPSSLSGHKLHTSGEYHSQKRKYKDYDIENDLPRRKRKNFIKSKKVISTKNDDEMLPK